MTPSRSAAVQISSPPEEKVASEISSANGGEVARSAVTVLEGVRRRQVLAGLALLVLAGAALHVFLLLTTRGAADDMGAYGLQAYAVTHGINIYEYTGSYPYPPLWIWIVRAMAQLTSAGLPFAIAIRLPATLADLGITLLLGWHEVRRLGWRPAALVAPALWALNPVAVIVAAGHGQFDSLPVFFMVLTVVLLDRGDLRGRYLAALALGVAIALKGYPVILLPYLFFTTPKGRRLAVGLLPLAPTVLLMAFYVLVAGYSSAMITHVIGYQSSADLGWSAVLRLFGVGLPRIPQMAVTVLAADLIVFWVLTQSRIFPSRADLAAAALFAAFYVVSPRGSVQYVVWGLPFLILAFRRLSIAYTVAGTVLLVGFYELQFPGALPGAGALGTLPLAGWVYLAGLLGVLLAGLLCVREAWERRERPAAERAPAPVIAVGAAVEA